MPLPLLAVGMLALPFLSEAGKGVKDNQAMLLVAGLGALWLFNKVKEPLEGLQEAYGEIKEKIEWVGDQADIVPEVKDFWKGLTQGRDTGTYVPFQYGRGLSLNPPTESWVEEYGDTDILFNVPPIPVREGLKPPTAYVRTNPPPTTTAEEFGILIGRGYSMIDPENPYEVDLPGFDPYDLRNLPGDIGGGLKKLYRPSWRW